MHSSTNLHKHISVESSHIPKAASIDECAITKIFDHSREEGRKKSMWCRSALILLYQRTYELRAKLVLAVNFH